MTIENEKQAKELFRELGYLLNRLITDAKNFETIQDRIEEIGDALTEYSDTLTKDKS